MHHEAVPKWRAGDGLNSRWQVTIKRSNFESRKTRSTSGRIQARKWP